MSMDVLLCVKNTNLHFCTENASNCLKMLKKNIIFAEMYGDE